MRNPENLRLRAAVLKTLCYADLFDYPLTGREVWEYLIGVRARDRVRVENILLGDVGLKPIGEKNGFFFLRGRKKIVELRKKRAEWAKEKMKIAQETANKLEAIPTIKMIGVTGALAVENCKEDDDIDLLIIASSNSLWLTRLLVIILCNLMGIKRRKPKDEKVRDKICFNLFLDEAHLRIEPENLFLAHEICQVKDVYDKGGIYEKFMEENKWVKEYLPNVLSGNKITIKQDNNLIKKSGIAILLSCYLAIVEKVAFFLQYLYMKPKITNEKVGLHQAFFHPKNLKNEIMEKYFNNLKLLGLDKKEVSF